MVVKRHLSESTIVSAGEEVVSCDLAGGAALLDMKSSVYFTLNDVGSTVWSLIQGQKSVSEILGALLASYDVDHDRCRDDLVALLQQLDDAGLIKILETAHPQVPDAERVG